MAKFKVGEVVVINSINNPQLRGVETEILTVFCDIEGFYYQCDVEPLNPRKTKWYESALKKKPDHYNGDELATWEECAWQPSKVGA